MFGNVTSLSVKICFKIGEYMAVQERGCLVRFLSPYQCTRQSCSCLAIYSPILKQIFTDRLVTLPNI